MAPSRRINDTSSDTAADATRLDRPMPGWKKSLLWLSVALMIAGAAMQTYAWLAPDAPQKAAERQGGIGDLAPGLQPTEGGGEAMGEPEPPAEQSPLDRWSPTIFRLGFSFFVGFAIGYAVRTFVKISIITIGVVLLLLFGLQYAGVIEVNWQSMEAHYETAVSWLREQTSSFAAFVRGYLPSAASAAGGFVIGFRKR